MNELNKKVKKEATKKNEGTRKKETIVSSIHRILVLSFYLIAAQKFVFSTHEMDSFTCLHFMLHFT